MKRNNWTKQMTILLAAVCLLLLALGGGAPSRQWNGCLLQVEGVPVSREIYSYFVSEALSDGSVALDKAGRPLDMPALRDEVKRRCAEYVAVSNELQRHGRTINPQRKAEVAERSAFVWRAFGAYYASIGVDKPTVNAVWRGRAEREQLFYVIYDDRQSPRHVPEEAIQTYFYNNFAALEGLRVFPTVALENGKEREMTIAERTELRQRLENFLQEANMEGAVFADVAIKDPHAATLSYMLPFEMVLQKGAGDMPDAAIDQLRKWKPGEVSLLFAENAYYVIGTGINMREAPERYYDLYRGECLRKLRGVEYEALLRALFAHYGADENVAEVERLLDKWPYRPMEETGIRDQGRGRPRRRPRRR